MLELDTKLGDFTETHLEVDNYMLKVKDKYNTLDLPYVSNFIYIIEKFKGKHSDIALVWRGTKPRSQNFIFDTQWTFAFFGPLRCAIAPGTVVRILQQSVGRTLKKSDYTGALLSRCMF